MSQTLGGWNLSILCRQIVVLVIVVGVVRLTHMGAQAGVIIGAICFFVLTAVLAAGAMRQEREIVYELSGSNACGLIALFFLVLAGINIDSVPTNVFTACVVGGITFLGAAVTTTVFAAKAAIILRVQKPMRELVLVAAPLGIGPAADWVIRSRAQMTKPA